METRIVCAANRVHCADGVTRLLIGARHWDLLMHEQIDVIKQMLKSQGYEGNRPYSHNISVDQGFIDQYRNYHDRTEAWIIAEKNGQIIRDVSGEGTLYSENLC